MSTDSLQITADGAVISYTATSARVPIPNTAAGTPPKFVRIVSIGQSCVRAGSSTVVATTTDSMVQPSDGLLLQVSGMTHIAAIAAAGGSGTVQISPLENQS
jgi:hypothetical protein